MRAIPLLGLAITAGVVGPVRAQEPLETARVRYLPPALVVEVRINGSPPLQFAFDTGASTSLIDTGTARQLNLSPQGASRAARVQRLAIGRAKVHDVELLIRDLSPLAKRMGTPLAGILGFNWMEHFVFEITYPRNGLTSNGSTGWLRLWPRSVELTATADQLPLPLVAVRRFQGAALYVPGRLEGVYSCKFELDTGTDTGVLGSYMGEQLGAPAESARSAGANRSLRFRPHRVARLELAGRLFTNVSFLVDRQRGVDGDPYGQCVIGNEQLRAFAVTIDILRGRAFFRPRSTTP